MFCSECGNECDDDSVYCDKCGTPLTYETRLVSYDEGGFNSSYVFKDMTFDELANKIHEIFTERGYKRKKGEIGNCVYDMESDTLSEFSYGTIKSYKFKVKVYPESDKMCLKIHRSIFPLNQLFLGYIKGREYDKIKKKIKAF